ncbi:MAG TPA: M protein trans-acting positive regulator, partial [Enterococcus sp.]|nr:M protein trans-acting positive regulator [Enterococcus sp.]
MDKLLEKEIILICQLAAALLEENPLPVKKAAAIQRISDKTVRRLIASRSNESAFFSCHITTG